MFLILSFGVKSQGYFSNLNQNPFEIIEKYDTSKVNIGISSYSTINNKLFGYPLEYNGDFQFQFKTYNNPQRKFFNNITTGFSIKSLHCFSNKPYIKMFRLPQVSINVITYYHYPSLMETGSFFFKKRFNADKNGLSTTIGLRGDIKIKSGYYNDPNNQLTETKIGYKYLDFPIGFLIKMKAKRTSFSIYKSNNEYWPIIKNLKNYNSLNSSDFYSPLVYGSMHYSVSSEFNCSSLNVQPYYIRTRFSGKITGGHINTFGFNFRLTNSEIDIRYSKALNHNIYDNTLRKRIMNIVYRFYRKKLSFHISFAHISEIYPIVDQTTLLLDLQNYYAVFSLGLQYHWY